LCLQLRMQLVSNLSIWRPLGLYVSAWAPARSGTLTTPITTCYCYCMLLHAIACYFGYLWHGIFVANLRLQRPGFMQLISRPGLWNLGPRLSAAMSCDLPRPSEAPAGPSLAVAAPASLMVFFLAGPSCKASRNFNDIYMMTYIYIIIYIYILYLNYHELSEGCHPLLSFATIANSESTEAAETKLC
jgi:hypothetical protein